MNYYEIGRQAVFYIQIFKYRALDNCKYNTQESINDHNSCQHAEEIVNLKNKILHLEQENLELKEKLKNIPTQPQLKINIVDADKLISENYLNREITLELVKVLLNASFT